MTINVNLRGKGDMEKADYDPDKDCVIALAQTEADMKKSVYDPDTNNVIEKAQLGLLYKYVVSDDLLHSHDTLTTTTSTTYAKLKTITLNTLCLKTSTIRIKFDGFRYGDFNQWLRIYKNGVGFGTEHLLTSSSWVTFTEDLEFTEGDTIEVWGKVTDANYEVRLQNLRLYGDSVLISLIEAIEDGRGGLNTPLVGANS